MLYIIAADPRITVVRSAHACQHRYKCSLSCSVGPKQAEGLVGLHFEIEALDSAEGSRVVFLLEQLSEVVDDQRTVVGFSHLCYGFSLRLRERVFLVVCHVLSQLLVLLRSQVGTLFLTANPAIQRNKWKQRVSADSELLRQDLEQVGSEDEEDGSTQVEREETGGHLVGYFAEGVVAVGVRTVHEHEVEDAVKGEGR